jgi:hypothetical protein
VVNEHAPEGSRSQDTVEPLHTGILVGPEFRGQTEVELCGFRTPPKRSTKVSLPSVHEISANSAFCPRSASARTSVIRLLSIRPCGSTWTRLVTESGYCISREYNGAMQGTTGRNEDRQEELSSGDFVCAEEWWQSCTESHHRWRRCVARALRHPSYSHSQ